MRRFLIQFLLLLLFLLAGYVPVVGSNAPPVRLYYFSAANCPHCLESGPRLRALLAKHPGIELVEQDIWQNRAALNELIALLATHGELPVATPTVFLADRVWVGLDSLSFAEIETKVEDCVVNGCADARARLSSTPPEKAAAPAGGDAVPVVLPLLGAIDPRLAPLPLVTVVLGLLDSVNPCAFFVLLFLLSLMSHAHSRGRMLTVGCVFVSFSGLIYFLFMAAWLNLFLLTGGMQIVTTFAALVALLIGALNIKDYFLFHRGPSLSIPERLKPSLYQRVRHLLQVAGYPSLLGGTVLLAIAANSYELLCTAGLPMVYTRILTLQNLPVWQYYGYLAAYNVVYVLPLLGIVVFFAMTLGAHRLSEAQGRILKLLSGVMMTELGLMLLFAPELLNSLLATAGVVLTTLVLALIFYCASRWRQRLQ